MRNVSLLLLTLCACDRSPPPPAEPPPPLPVLELRRSSPYPARAGLAAHLTIEVHDEGDTEALILAEVKKRVAVLKTCLEQNVSKLDDAAHAVRFELSPAPPQVTVRSDWPGAEPALPCLQAVAERLIQRTPLSQRADVRVAYRVAYRDARLE